MMDQQFQNIVNEWRAASFPSGGSAEALDEAHADLALCDAWVADAVIPFIENARRVRPVPDVVARIDELLARLVSLEASGATRFKVVEYVSYAMLLRDVYIHFLRVGSG